MGLSNQFKILVILLLSLLIAGCGGEIKRDYWPDGKLKSEIPYDSKGKIHGTAKWFYNDGTPEAEVNYDHGVLNGELVRWDQNGPVISVDFYLNGKLDGVSTEYSYTGARKSEKTYKDGLLEGEYRDWHNSKQLKCEGLYHKGNMDGNWLYWDVAGNLVGRGEYKDGNGVKKVYNPMGRLIEEVKVENNRELE